MDQQGYEQLPQSTKAHSKKAKRAKYDDDEDYGHEDERVVLNIYEESSQPTKSKKFSFEEPDTHVNNIPAVLQCLQMCYPDRKNRLTRDELYSYNKVKDEANVVFGPNSEDFFEYFADLFRGSNNRGTTTSSQSKMERVRLSESEP